MAESQNISNSDTNASIVDIDENYQCRDLKILVRRRLLLRENEVVPLGGRAFDTLVMLLRHAGEIVSSESLRHAIWPGMVVADSNVAVHITSIRRAMGRHGRTDLITIARRGYSFAGPIERLSGEEVGGSLRRSEEASVKTAGVREPGNLRAANRPSVRTPRGCSKNSFR